MSAANEGRTRPADAGRPTPEDLWFLKATAAAVLVAAANGTLDLDQLARDELIRRGLDPEGEWVGPSRARELHHPNH